MGIIGELFSWWGGNTWGTRYTIWKCAKKVGQDDLGNIYYEQTNGVGPLGVPRRFVVYKSMSEASLVPPEWHGWLHYTVDEKPTDVAYAAKPWQKAHQPNMTGTAGAYRPAGSILSTAKRPKATGDYKPWRPD